MHSTLEPSPAQQNAASISGLDSFALQRAADEVARAFPTGGGILSIPAGEFTMFDSLHLRVPMTVRGAGETTILKKCPQFRSTLLQDFDLSELSALVKDPSGLRPGMGVTVSDRSYQSGWDPVVRTIVAIDGNRITLDRRPERDYAFASEAWVQNSFPLIEAHGINDITIEDLVVDGNLAENRDAPLDGCRGGGIYFHDVERCTIRRCIGRNYNGDGFSWQTTRDVLVEDCLAHDNTVRGFHPGTGSPRSILRRCHAHHNGFHGLYICWGVTHGQFTDNRLEDNGWFGISIGHKDTDNLIANNQIRRNGKAGIYFRDDTAANSAHRATLRNNIIEDNGHAEPNGAGVRIEGHATGTLLEGNTIRDTRAGDQRTQKIALDIGPHVAKTTVRPDNRIEGEVTGAKIDKG